MERVPVRSSNLRSVGYLGGILEVEFHSGKVYQYHGVAERVHVGLMSAPSKGRYLDRFVKGTWLVVRMALICAFARR
jgi:hypothetical protein